MQRLDPLCGSEAFSPPIGGRNGPRKRETLREAVYRLDGGICVMTGEELPEDGGTWCWSVHHVIKAQELRRRRVSTKDPNLCILLGRRAHERHESRFLPVPYEKLPRRVLLAVVDLGTWAEDNLRRYHPPAS